MIKWHLRFTGQKEDASGLQYFNARFYDPVIGMFVSPDTVVPQPGLTSDYNRYLAFRGNPLKFVDPSGHCIIQGLAGSDTEENQQCWNAAIHISTLMENDPDNPVFNGESQDHFVAYVAPNPQVGLSMLQSILDSYWTDFYTSAGIHNTQYNSAPLMNPNPNKSSKSIKIVINGKVLFIAGLKAGTVVGPLMAESGAAMCAGVVTCPAGVAVATTGAVYTAVGWVVFVGEDIVLPILNSGDWGEAFQNGATEAALTVAEEFGPKAIGPYVPWIGVGMDVSEAICIGTDCGPQ